MKYFLLLTLFFTSGLSLSQTLDRFEIKGKITVPEGFDSGGINIFNQSSSIGTISSGSGEFSLEVGVGDSLYFSAVQFEALKVEVNRETIASGLLRVEITEGLNELPEIIIKPHDLTGNLSEDIKNVEVVTLDLPPMSGWGNISSDGQSSPQNTTINEIGGGANHFLLLVKAVNFLFPKKRKKEKDRELSMNDKINLEEELRTTYDDSFFRENFDIPPSEISNFLSFCMEKGIDPDLFSKNRELELIQVLMQYNQEYQHGKVNHD